MAEAILEVAGICKSYPPHKLRSRLQNIGKNLSGPQLRQWTDEIYPQYAEECGIAEAVAPLVRAGRASPNIVNKTLKKSSF